MQARVDALPKCCKSLTIVDSNDLSSDGRRTVGGAADAIALFAPLLVEGAREGLIVAYLDREGILLHLADIVSGFRDEVDLPIRAIAGDAVRLGATGVILAHNHPSGDPTPSREDVRLTRQLVECSRLLDLPVHDHVIVGRGRYVSLAEKGLI